MDKDEAQDLLRAELVRWQERSYSELVERLLDRQEVREVIGPSGAWYQLEVQAFWDAQPDGVLRVLGAIDDGRGFRANVPLTDDFLVAPDGSSVGE